MLWARSVVEGVWAWWGSGGRGSGGRGGVGCAACRLFSEEVTGSSEMRSVSQTVMCENSRHGDGLFGKRPNGASVQMFLKQGIVGR